MTPTYGEDRQLEVWAKCRRCNDQFSLFLWGQRDLKEENLYDVWVEPNRSVVVGDDGSPFHRCGGLLTLYGNPHQLRFRPRW